MPKPATLEEIKKLIETGFKAVNERIDDLGEAMQLHASETDRQFREIRSTMATKDYVDDRIGELRGEFRQALKQSRVGRAGT